MPGYIEKVLSERIEVAATTFRISQSKVLRWVLNEETMTDLSKELVRYMKSEEAAAEEHEPVSVSRVTAARLCAALGMAITIASNYVDNDRVEALGLIKNAAKAIVHLGASSSRGSDNPIVLDGLLLGGARYDLTLAADNVHNGTWSCNCPDNHDNLESCRVVDQLRSDASYLQ